MKLETFRRRAGALWREIPPPFREGVDGLEIDEETVPHPDLGGIYTLGECVSDVWPSAYSEEGGEVRSRVLLHYGSFRALAAEDPVFEWESEIRETLHHELLHHREFAASESALEDYDRAVEENFRRHAGRPFDPFFYRAVPADSDGVVRIESELFLETRVPGGARTASFRWRERSYSLRIPDVEHLLFVNPRTLVSGRLWVVVCRRRPWWKRIFGVESPPGVEQITRRALPLPRSDREA